MESIALAGSICGIFSFLVLILVVGLILAFNEEEEPRSYLNKLKNRISQRVGWLGKPKVMTKLLIGMGFLLGLFSLIVGSFYS